MGVIHYNENRLEEMGMFMELIHSYVPTNIKEEEFILPNGESISQDSTTFHQILFGVDQLTRGNSLWGQKLRASHDTALYHLGGIAPI